MLSTYKQAIRNHLYPDYHIPYLEKNHGLLVTTTNGFQLFSSSILDIPRKTVPKHHNNMHALHARKVLLLF